jgi:hypothetical protein
MAKRLASGLALVLAFAAGAAHAATGEYWEVTNKMEMAGMALPGMTSKVCIPKGGEKDPRNVNGEKDCEMTDVKISGNKSSWKMRCAKDGDVMTGSGELTSTPDRTEGVIKMNSKQGDMTMNFVNKRIGGACDPDEMKKKVDAMVDANNAQLAKQCEGLSTGRQWLGVAPLVIGNGAVCAPKRAQFCEAIKRDAARDIGVYFDLKSSGQSSTKACGISMDASKKSLCKSVDINNPDFNKQLRGNYGMLHRDALRAECPGEMKTYAELSRKRYCEGRGFTEQKAVSLADCLKGMGPDDAAMNTPDPDEPPVPLAKPQQAAGNPPAGNTSNNALQIPGLPANANPTEALIDGAKKLKNLFGF